MPNKNTLFVGKVLLELPQLSSTNQYAQDLLTKSKPSEGTVISTFHQTAGRGQIGSSWVSAPGENITMSVIFFPTFLRPDQQFLLNMAFSLSVRDMLARQLPQPPKVKWPNDIYVRDRKITGILLQNAIGGGAIQSCVAGFGINVNQTEFPADIPNPTSLKLLTGCSYDLHQLLDELCRALEFRYLQLRRQDWPALESEYLHALYGWQEERLFQTPGGSPFHGRITGIDAAGRLLIQHDQGQVQAYSLKEIQFVI